MHACLTDRLYVLNSILGYMISRILNPQGAENWLIYKHDLVGYSELTTPAVLMAMAIFQSAVV